MGITVNELLNEPFCNRTRDEKERIVLEGRPRPFLQNLHLVDNLPPSTSEEDVNNRVNNFIIFFDVSSYDHVEWLTGCDMRQALFCWSCLLFRVQKDQWNTTGITDLSLLQENIENHEKSVSHIQGMLDLHLFSQQIKIENPTDVNIDHDSELIKRNREIVKRVIDVICFLVTQQQPPRAGTSDKNKLQIEDCLENLQFLRDYDILQANLIDDATDMLQIAPKVVSDMIDAITSVMKLSVQKETHQSVYVSMILSEHSEEPMKSQLSTVLRYLKDGEVCERFIGFTNSEGHKLPSSIFGHINKVITDFQISRRVIAYSLDGSVLHTVAALNEVKKELKFRHPFVYFVPCHFLKLDYVLQQSLSFIPDCDYFFKNLTALGAFFRIESRICQDFQSFRSGEVPDLDILNSTDHVEFFNRVKSFRRCLTEFFEYLISNSENLTSDNLVKIYGLRTFLTDMKTVFFIEAFIKLFELIAPLNEALGHHTPYKAFDNNMIDNILQALQNEQEYSAFDSLWKEIFREFGEISEPDASLHAVNRHSRKFTFHRLYLDVTKCMSSQIKCRFENAKKLLFFNILNLERSEKSLHYELVQSLLSAYGECFNDELVKEIKLLDSNKCNINAESVHQLLKLFLTTALGRSFGNLLKLCEIILTMPCTSSSVECPSSKLQEIKTWAYSPGKYETPGDMSMLCIEKDYLEKLRKNVSFYDEVIIKFQEINKTMQLVNA